MPHIDTDRHWLKPGELAARTGVAVSTPHYYESLGLPVAGEVPGHPVIGELLPALGDGITFRVR